MLELRDRAAGFKFLIRDRDAKFTAMFDEVFRAEGIRVLQPPGSGQQPCQRCDHRPIGP
jgi:putative transposase